MKYSITPKWVMVFTMFMAIQKAESLTKRMFNNSEKASERMFEGMRAWVRTIPVPPHC